MITNIRLELSNEERSNIGLGHLVTRKEVTELVHKFIKEQIDGEQEVRPMQRGDDQPSPLPRTGLSEQSDATFKAEMSRAESAASAFTPSRGDEDYLTQPKDPGIAAACSRILDDTKLIEEFAWETIERNRK